MKSSYHIVNTINKIASNKIEHRTYAQQYNKIINKTWSSYILLHNWDSFTVWMANNYSEITLEINY